MNDSRFVTRVPHLKHGRSPLVPYFRKKWSPFGPLRGLFSRGTWLVYTGKVIYFNPLSAWTFQPVTFGVHSTQIWYSILEISYWKVNQWKELIDWFSDQRTDVSYAYMLAGVYGITSLASSWIISPLNYWNMTDGHNFRTQACFKSQLLIGSNFCPILKTWKALRPAIQKMPSTKRRWATKNHDR